MKLRNLMILTALLAVIVICTCAANAETVQTLKLPARLKVVGEQAFYQATSLNKVIVPEGTTTIENKAFAYSSLQEISLPRSLTSIAEDAFEGCGQFKVKVPMNCYAYTWCIDHGYIGKPDPSPAGDFTYEAINGLYARITGYIGSDTIVVIPSEIDDFIIQEIGKNSFANNTSIEGVYIPDSVTVVSDQAFRNCSSLCYVDLGKGVESLGYCAFYACASLEQFHFPDSVTTLDQAVLANCDNLIYVNYPKNWTTANSNGYVFAGCSKLTNIDVPAGVTFIPNYAFANCTNLKKITLPEGLENVYHHAFSNCTGLTEMVYPSTIKTVGGINGCTGITKIVIPDGAVTIGTNAFDSVPLKNIIIPDSVTKVLDNAFQNCSYLETVDFGNGILSIGSYAFYKCTAVEKLLLPDSVEIIGDYAFANCSNLNEFHYPINWTRSNSNSCGHNFDNCTKLKRIKIPEGATAIPRAAFAYASFLKYVTIPSTMKGIGDEAFKGCIAITSLEFNDGIERIGISAFEDCSNLTTAELPDSVTDLYSKAFRNCSKLNTFRYPLNWARVASKSDINYNDGFIFQGCVSLTQITIPEGVVSIPTSAFNGASYIKTISFPSTLESIGSCGLRGCSGLTALSFPDGLLSLGNYSLEDCTGITKLSLPDSVTRIGGASFRGCSNLSSFHYPQNWTSTSYYKYDIYSVGYIFDNCPKLTSITMPEGVTVVPADAFAHCRYLQSVYVPVSVTKVVSGSLYGGGAFDDSPNLTIHCEYGSYILKYAKDNSIPYYYLTPDGVNPPSGTLYKGDSYALYGYARASVPLTDVTATIWDSTGKNAVQTISVNPATTDYNLAGTINTNMLFGVLPLGSYRYTLSARTDVSEEVWANNAFTIVPPPLRVSVSGLDNLTGTVGNDYVWNGMIYANYPITSLTVTLKNVSSGTAYPSYSCSPNTTAYSLNNVTGIDFAGKPTGNYQLTLVICGNGETRTFNTFFSIGKYDGNISSDVFSQLVSFAGNANNRSIFDKYNEGSSFLGSITITDTILMAVNFRSQMCIDIISQQLREDHLSQFMIKRYKKEIAAIIDDVDPQTKLVNSDSTYNDLVDSMTSNLRITFTLNENDSMVTKRMMNLSRIINFQLDKIERLCKINSWIGDAKEYYSAFMQNYENSMLILEAYSGYNSSSSPELKKAVEELADDYDSKVFKALNILTNMLVDKLSKALYSDALKLFEAATDFVDKKLTGQYGDYSIMWSAVNYAIDVTMELNNYDDIADSLMNTLIRVETFGQALDAYHQAFDKVRNGDTSTSALNRLAISYQLCCSAGTRMYDSLAETAWYKTNFDDNTTFMDLYSELWRMEYKEPFDNWR